MSARRLTKGAGLFKGIKVTEDAEVGGDVLIDEATVTRMVKRIDVSNTTGAAGAFSWEVPKTCFVGPILVHTVDPPGASRTIDIGVTDDADGSSDNIMDAYQIGTLVGKNGNSIRHNGTNGRGFHYATKGQFVTGTLQAALTGTHDVDVYIFYTPIV